MPPRAGWHRPSTCYRDPGPRWAGITPGPATRSQPQSSGGPASPDSPWRAGRIPAGRGKLGFLRILPEVVSLRHPAGPEGAGSGPSPGARDGGSVRECGGLVASSGPGPTADRQLAEIAERTANATAVQGGSELRARGGAAAAADRDIRYATSQAPGTSCARRRTGPFGSVPRNVSHGGEHVARLRQDRLLELRSVGDPDI